MAKDVLSYYHGSDPGQIPGLFPQHYQWWESGAVWGSLIDYWDYTGDAQYVALVQQALLSQLGPKRYYMPPTKTKYEVALLLLLKKKKKKQLLPNADRHGTYRETMIKQSGR